jgi:hypothetical protein
LKCDICGCVKKHNQKAYGYNLCQKHYHQYRTYGYFKDNIPTSCFDENMIIKYDEYAEIILVNRQYNEVGRAIIDIDDIEKCRLKKWRLSWHSDNYKGVITGNGQSNDTFVLSRYILGITDKEIVVDHQNGHPLDNRKVNLRICTLCDNALNKTKLLTTNTSGFCGVIPDSRKNRKTKWIAEIEKSKKKVYLGAYIELCDAVYARYIAEQTLFKEFRSGFNDEMIHNEIEKCTNQNAIANKVIEKIIMKGLDY